MNLVFQFLFEVLNIPLQLKTDVEAVVTPSVPKRNVDFSNISWSCPEPYNSETIQEKSSMSAGNDSNMPVVIPKNLQTPVGLHANTETSGR